LKKLACFVGRHRWATVVAEGESYRRCSVCGRTPRGGGKSPMSQGDLDYMKSSGQSDSSISGGY
jgi:hypothetical protein